VEGVDKLFSMAFGRVCALKEVQRFGVDSFVQTRPATFVEGRQALAVESEARVRMNEETVVIARYFSFSSSSGL